MPLFEYKCEDCDTKYEVLHKSSKTQDEVFCPNCKSKNSKKLISVFSAKNSSSTPDFGGCSDGSCGMPSYGGGCQNGMCGFN
jgi:putative FmdB family regulatory protein